MPGTKAPIKVSVKDIEFGSSDGASTCKGTLWLPGRRRPRAIVQLVHGMVEHIGRYDEFARSFASRGFTVCGIDHLGHGRTTPEPAKRGIYDHKCGANQLIEDQHSLMMLVKERYPGKPYVLVGHSMGSFVTRCCMERFGDELTAAVVLGTGWMDKRMISANKTILSTAAILRGWDYRSKIIDDMGIGGYNKHFAAECEGELTGAEWLSRDLERIQQRSGDSDSGFMFSLSGYYTVMNLMRESEDEGRIALIPKDLPVLIESGTDDPVGDFGVGPRRLRDVLVAAGVKDVTLELVEGARHELINEINREELIAGIIDWVEARVLA